MKNAFESFRNREVGKDYTKENTKVVGMKPSNFHVT